MNTATASRTKKGTRSNKKQHSPSAGKAQGDSMLKEFFTDELKDIYWAEKALTKALPKMQKAATTEELKTAIGDHLESGFCISVVTS